MPTEFVAELQARSRLTSVPGRQSPRVVHDSVSADTCAANQPGPLSITVKHARAGDRRADRDARIVEAGADLDPSVAFRPDVPHAPEVGDNAGEHPYVSVDFTY